MAPAPAPRADLRALDAYVGGVQRLPGVDEPVRLASNEGAFGPPPGAVAAHRAASAALHRYPDGGSTALRAAIAARFGVEADRVVCDTGSDPIFTLLALAYGGPGTELVMSEHGFSIYALAQSKAGGAVVRAPERALRTDIDAVLGCVTERTRLVCIANPNNPTGSLIDAATTVRLRERLPPDVLLVIDAAYAEYVDDPDYDPGIALVRARDDVVMTRTFSKLWGLGGARLGWAYAAPAVIDVLNRIREPFGVPLPTQAAAIAALAEPDWLERSRAHNRRERARLVAALGRADVRAWPSETNFVLADFGTEARARAADAHFRAHGIIVRHVASYALPHCLRITLGTTAEMDRVADALGSFRPNDV